MPHIIIEHSKPAEAKVDLSALAKDLHFTLSKQETVKLEAIKTRTVSVENVYLGGDAAQDFLHITLKLLPGRNLELKEKMVRAIHDKVLSFLPPKHEFRVSVELAELGVYLKN